MASSSSAIAQHVPLCARSARPRGGGGRCSGCQKTSPSSRPSSGEGFGCSCVPVTCLGHYTRGTGRTAESRNRRGSWGHDFRLRRFQSTCRHDIRPLNAQRQRARAALYCRSCLNSYAAPACTNLSQSPNHSRKPLSEAAMAGRGDGALAQAQLHSAAPTSRWAHTPPPAQTAVLQGSRGSAAGPGRARAARLTACPSHGSGRQVRWLRLQAGSGRRRAAKLRRRWFATHICGSIPARLRRRTHTDCDARGSHHQRTSGRHQRERWRGGAGPATPLGAPGRRGHQCCEHQLRCRLRQRLRHLFIQQVRQASFTDSAQCTRCRPPEL